LKKKLKFSWFILEFLKFFDFSAVNIIIPENRVNETIVEDNDYY